MLKYIGFQNFPNLEITFNPVADNKLLLNKETGEKLNIYTNMDDIGGEVNVKLINEEPFAHLGIHIELIGIICKYILYNLTKVCKSEDYKSEFINMNKELSAPGELSKSTIFYFSFKKVSLPYESYEGENILVRYFIRVTIIKKIFATKLSIEKNFLVYNPTSEPELNANVRMEVGVSNTIHMEYELFKNKCHLNDCVMGKIYFLKVAMKVKTVEVHFVKKEIFGANKSDTVLISKFEIVDGCPVNGDVVPIRMFLNGFSLSPTYKELNNVISIKYYLKFVVIDEDGKSFYKQQEITLWRKSLI